MDHAREIDLSWAGGFWDGEGSLSLNTSKLKRGIGRPLLQASIQQNHPEVLTRFCDIVGCGKVYGPYARRSRNCSEWHQWALGGGQVILFFELLQPCMSSVKRLQGEAAIARWGEYVAVVEA